MSYSDSNSDQAQEKLDVGDTFMTEDFEDEGGEEEEDKDRNGADEDGEHGGEDKEEQSDEEPETVDEEQAPLSSVRKSRRCETETGVTRRVIVAAGGKNVRAAGHGQGRVQRARTVCRGEE